MDKKVLIGVATNEFGRHAAFHDYFNLMDKPDGCIVTMVHGQSPAKARNLLFQAALEHDCTHAFIMDDDMAPPPNTLTKLLAHNLDLVSGYYLTRSFPHQGLIFRDKLPDGTVHWVEIAPDQTGLVKSAAAGLGCLLINLSVLDGLEQPWVRLGEIEKDGWCDDIGFFNRLAEKGHQLYIDLDCPLGHIGNMIVTPFRQNGEWHVAYNTFGNDSVSFPMRRRENVIRESTRTPRNDD